LSVGFAGTDSVSSAWNNVLPLYQGMLADAVFTLSPSIADTGTNGTFSALIPTIAMILVIAATASLYFASSYFTASILLMATIICLTPSVVARNTCSFVCACGPSIAEHVMIAASAWLVPVIMFLTKSRWPGASMTVKKYLSV
jgi:hypothetical protein